MNELFFSLGIEAWKPWVTALVLPPLPFLVLVLVGARLMFRRRLLAWFLILLAVLGLWFGATVALGSMLVRVLTQPPPSLIEREITELRKAPKTAIVVLGGGRRVLAPEYGVSSLNERSIERLRFGIWLSRGTQLPLLFSGGVGHAAPTGASEAEIAARVAEQEFGLKLRWTEGNSRDTRENARASVALLQAAGIEQIVLVTHDYHMTRARGHFEREMAPHGMKLVMAPMGLPASRRLVAMDWIPTDNGFELVRLALREWLGRVVGA
jgi:uncharacterized SAM-binding protein YcdF (DUF218 family)